ncbi:poly(A)-specific ribonuclease PARN-like [Rhodamnia argentea]|uniref:Poly(A)-specific ribonuclease PARN-like n=1 Tax=Rhodamnia argentea TaxID=178133 RepID=A0A8B8QMP6_9MYRT|nr:poly(A)-specific ribonuclease PARN-like [Rhodamnia argentea]
MAGKGSGHFLRRFCTITSNASAQKWSVAQVFKSNFAESLEGLKAHVSGSDFIAVWLRRTGSSSAAWHRVSSFDTLETAYSKAKHAAEKFQVLQFAVCPFEVRASKVVAHPYNFHLFPRDELEIKRPSYSFMCQSSHLASMVDEGFDFNACIYDGISYLSREQECLAKVWKGIPVCGKYPEKSSSSPSVADAVFLERIRSRIKQWKNSFEDSSTRNDEPLVRSMRKLILGSEEYGSRPSMTIDVCSQNQVQHALEVLAEFSEDLVPLTVPAKGAGAWAVRVILTSSKEDKNLLEQELQNLEHEQTKAFRGFREVIELISAAQKPIVSLNSLNDFTSIYPMFLAPLPSDVDEFLRSLRLVFPQVFDVNHLMKEIAPLGKTTSIATALSFLNNQFFAPVDVEVSPVTGSEGKHHGLNVVRICHLFAKLCSILRSAPESSQSDSSHQAGTLERFANIYRPWPSADPLDESISIWRNDTRRANCRDVVFLWGFEKGLSSKMLKSQLQGSHKVFSENFDVRLVDKSCAIVIFWQPGLSGNLLSIMNSSDLSGPLLDLVSEGLKAAGYETYMKLCRLGLFDADLADAFDHNFADDNGYSEDHSTRKNYDVHSNSESMIYLEEL